MPNSSRPARSAERAARQGRRRATRARGARPAPPRGSDRAVSRRARVTPRRARSCEAQMRRRRCFERSVQRPLRRRRGARRASLALPRGSVRAALTDAPLRRAALRSRAAATTERPALTQASLSFPRSPFLVPRAGAPSRRRPCSARACQPTPRRQRSGAFAASSGRSGHRHGAAPKRFCRSLLRSSLYANRGRARGGGRACAALLKDPCSTRMTARSSRSAAPAFQEEPRLPHCRGVCVCRDTACHARRVPLTWWASM